MTATDFLIINLIIITLLPIVAKAPVALAMKKLGGGNIGGYDNKLPREQQKSLSGFGARCLAAHQNSFEALIMFTPALLVVMTTGMANDTHRYDGNRVYALSYRLPILLLVEY